ncbi:hypothetical protein BDN71DRAFT_1453736 [Pleurotus eryngii]|uniref:Uncharacterized protein n=1 Tax=Pleurotus eryngii TaxID=5323 RepID=A0A9P5ZP16_PLEER|nr:hypothetical protein BDN71DRAFT_1453736 [Pleurotus eryngii]
MILAELIVIPAIFRIGSGGNVHQEALWVKGLLVWEAPSAQGLMSLCILATSSPHDRSVHVTSEMPLVHIYPFECSPIITERLGAAFGNESIAWKTPNGTPSNYPAKSPRTFYAASFKPNGLVRRRTYRGVTE